MKFVPGPRINLSEKKLLSQQINAPDTKPRIFAVASYW